MNTATEILQDVEDQAEQINECAIAIFNTMKRMVSPHIGVGILLDMASQLVIANGVAKDAFLKAVGDAYDLSVQAINGVVDEAE